MYWGLWFNIQIWEITIFSLPLDGLINSKEVVWSRVVSGAGAIQNFSKNFPLGKQLWYLFYSRNKEY